MSAWMRCCLVFAAGGFGATLRYLVGIFALKWQPGEHYLGTLMVNLLGCLAFGFVFELGRPPVSLSPEVKLILLTGFLGGFTTFSAYSGEAIQLFHSRGLLWAAGYVAVQNVVGIALGVTGILCARALSA